MGKNRYKKEKKRLKMHEYKIILMNHEGDTICEYNSYVVPTVNDNILIEDDKNFIVQTRHFSLYNLKVVLLGELDKSNESEEIKK